MSSRWGVYSIQGKRSDGSHTTATDPAATRWFIRWRVDGNPHKRTFARKGHARTFHERLVRAQVLGLPADPRGWPADPTLGHAPDTEPVAPAGLTVEEYCRTVWWPIHGPRLEDKNRLGHRRNMEVAIRLLRYTTGDDRRTVGQRPDDSIVLGDLRADDCKRAIIARSNFNDRTAAANRRRLATANGGEPRDLPAELASPGTVRAFYVTLNMIMRSALASGHLAADVMAGCGSLAPRPRPERLTDRLLPSVHEVFDLADAIATLGPRMTDGFPRGERFRTLVLCAGTAGGRPGELVAHRPDDIDWSGTGALTFRKTEAAVYDSLTAQSGRRERPLKHREKGESRHVPLLIEVRDALQLHHQRGYTTLDRTWTSPTGTAHLDWGNITDNYWRQACHQVFAGTAKAHLASMPPKSLRKTAITFWLESGISTALAAEWAGHSEEVCRQYYAGRTTSTFEKEAGLLARDFGAGIMNDSDAH